MEIPFVKYQGTGNDFILIDGRIQIPELDVEFWCNRKFGIGADGLMILAPSKEPNVDFEMIYYNSDGNLSSMCGNGGRCIAHWAHDLGIGRNGHIVFNAPDGHHEAWIDNDTVNLSMNDVDQIIQLDNNDVQLNTGSPHYVKKCKHLPDTFVEEAKQIRLSTPYKKEGINVNFYIEQDARLLECRTFERGVEDETLSCGTGVTAVALAHAQFKQLNNGKITVVTQGGKLALYFEYEESTGKYQNLFLEGPAEFVFKGTLDI